MGDLNDSMREIVEREIIKELRTTPEYIEDLVRAAITIDVNQWGSAYGSQGGRNEQRIPYFKYLVRERIQGIADEIVKAWLAEHRETIEKTIRERISETSVVDALAKAFAGSTKEDWKIDVKFSKESY